MLSPADRDGDHDQPHPVIRQLANAPAGRQPTWILLYERRHLYANSGLSTTLTPILQEAGTPRPGCNRKQVVSVHPEAANRLRRFNPAGFQILSHLLPLRFLVFAIIDPSIALFAIA